MITDPQRVVAHRLEGERGAHVGEPVHAVQQVPLAPGPRVPLALAAVLVVQLKFKIKFEPSGTKSTKTKSKVFKAFYIRKINNSVVCLTKCKDRSVPT